MNSGVEVTGSPSIAISWPTTEGDSLGARITDVGRLPGNAVGDELRRHSGCLHLGPGLAEGERPCLSEEIRHEHVVLAAEIVGRLDEADEVGGSHGRSLMEELTKGMLAVGSRLTPHDRTRFEPDRRPVEPHSLSVGFHVELLQVGREPVLWPAGTGCQRVRGPEQKEQVLGAGRCPQRQQQGWSVSVTVPRAGW